MLKEYICDQVQIKASKTNKTALPYYLTALELTQLQNDYPELTLVAKVNKKHNHAYAASARICTMNLLLDFTGYTKFHKAALGDDVFVVAIGGDYVSHLKQGRMNVS